MKLFASPNNPIPDSAVCGEIEARDGVQLRFARFPAKAPNRGTVCLFTGRAEQIEKYFEVIEELRGRGFTVAALDWRGQGGSQRFLRDPRRGYVGAFDDYQLDVETLVHNIAYPDCPPPFFALGHSLGGAVLIRVAKNRHRWFERTVVVSPMIEVRLKWPRAARLMTRLARRLGLGRSYVRNGGADDYVSRPFAGNLLTSDPDRYARNAAIVEAHPELGLGAPTIAWGDEALRATAEFADPGYPSSIRQPLLVIAAGADRVVSTVETERFAIRLLAGAGLIIPGARHEILQERTPYRRQFWAAFDSYIPGSAS